MKATLDSVNLKELTNEELDAVSGGFFVVPAPAAAPNPNNDTVAPGQPGSVSFVNYVAHASPEGLGNVNPTRVSHSS